MRTLRSQSNAIEGEHTMKFCRSARSLVLASAIVAVSILGMAPAAHADAVCGDTCVVNPGVQTPAGLVTVTATAANIVTVHIDAAKPNTLVIGIPFSYPPGPPVLPSHARTTIATLAAGTVNIDTVVFPPGPPTRPAPPNLVIISIHPPSPCRVQTTGSTVTFTPIAAQP